MHVPSSATIGCEIGFAAASTSRGPLRHSRADSLSRGERAGVRDRPTVIPAEAGIQSGRTWRRIGRVAKSLPRT